MKSKMKNQFYQSLGKNYFQQGKAFKIGTLTIITTLGV